MATYYVSSSISPTLQGQLIEVLKSNLNYGSANSALLVRSYNDRGLVLSEHLSTEFASVSNGAIQATISSCESAEASGVPGVIKIFNKDRDFVYSVKIESGASFINGGSPIVQSAAVSFSAPLRITLPLVG